MATIARQRNPRSMAIFGASAERDDQVGITLNATTYSRSILGPARTGQASVHLEWGAGWTGTFTIQYTLNPRPEESTDADWVTDSGATVIGDALAVAGAAGKCIIFVGNVLPEWYRIKAAHTGGSATLRAWARTDGDN